MAIDSFIMLGTISMTLALAYGAYFYFLKPKKYDAGVYLNPRLGRRKIPFIVTPDGHGTLKGMIDEEGDPELGIKYSTLIVEMEGEEMLIPHVCVNRDVKPMNPKQMYAGSDAPVLICVVDRNGIRWPGMFDSLRAPVDRTIEDDSMYNELKELKTNYARLKQNMRALRSDESVDDKIEQKVESVSRLRKSMISWMNNDEMKYQQDETGGNIK